MSPHSVTLTWPSDAPFRGARGPLKAWLRRALAPFLALLLAACATTAGPVEDPAEAVRWRSHAENVTIVRDDWGIAHVRGRTDADAVFGMVYAQAEDDFNRIETNYINAMGRLA